MGTGYTRNDTPNNIADGNVINASDLDGEFDAVQAAFNGSTGHSHDGTTGEGPQIATAGLADNAVTTAKITDANVTTAKIADSNVTLAKMAANSVDSDQYVDGSIDRVHLAADIVDGTKIADDSIDSEHYVDGSIDTAHIGNLQVTTAKIAADAIDGTKLADNAVDSEHYTDGSIDRVHLAADIVDGTKIADDSIDSEHYVDGSIDTAHIADDAVTSAKLDTNIQIAGTLGVTGVSSFADGSNSAPSLTFTSDTNTGIYRGGTDILKFVTAGTDRLTIDASGVITSDVNGAVRNLDLNNEADTPFMTFSESGAVNFFIGESSIVGGGGVGFYDLYATSGLGQRFFTNALKRMQIESNGDISFYEDTGTTPKLFWDASTERLGIGTSSPSGKLNLATGASTACELRLTSNNTGSGAGDRGRIVVYSSRNDGTAYEAGKIEIDRSTGTTDEAHMLFATNGGSGNTERMRISSSGNVGIGETSPLGILHIKEGDSGVTSVSTDADQLVIENNAESGISILAPTNSASRIAFGDSDNNKIGQIYYNHTSNFMKFDVNNAERLRIDSSGNVGIGTTSPSSFNSLADNLVVGTTSGENGITIASGSANSGRFVFSDNSTSSAAAFVGAIEYSHSSDAMILYTATSERMRIDSSGNVGIGTSSPSETLDVSGDARATRLIGRSLIEASSGFSSDTFAVMGGNTSNASTSHGAVFFSKHVDSNALLVGTHDATFNSFVVKGSGNVGIGTSSPSQKLDVNGTIVASTTASQGARIERNGTTGGANFDSVLASGSLHFRTGATERMRINSDGALCINRTNQANDERLAITGVTGEQCMSLTSPITTAYDMINIINGNGQVGSIQTNGTSTSYNTSSDHRLKENVTADWDATTRLKQLNPVRFNFIADADTTVDGFLAHEVQSVVPEAITGTHNEVDADGNPVYQGIDQSKLVPLLVKTIQELEARITALENGE